MSPQAGYLLKEEVVPRLRSAIPQVVNFVGCEDAQEVIQDATAMAAKLLHNVEQAGKTVTPGNIAYYTIQHVKSGRRSTGSSVADVMATGTQLKARCRLSSLEEVVSSDEETGGEIFTFNDVLSKDEEDPATKATRKMDWEEFMAGLSQRDRLVIQFMLEGKTLRDAAQSMKLSDSTMQGTRRNLVRAIHEFMGTSILADVQRSPAWMDNLEATREKSASREERRH
jgi:DNA-binding NarL/FixJ family response regulator